MVAYLHERSSFAGWVLNDTPPVLTGEDGLRCVEILQAAYISAETSASVDRPLARDERRPLVYRRAGKQPAGAAPVIYSGRAAPSDRPS
jgi:hypothetical protein